MYRTRSVTTTMAKKEHLHIIPTMVFFNCIITFTITFIIAVKLNHVTPAFPYISDTGTLAPESCIFSQLLNISSILMALCVYVRHLQVDKFATFRNKIGPRLGWNRIATYTGYSSCFGMSMVANFQVGNLWELHYMGALLCFVGGTVYFICQTIFSYHMAKMNNTAYLFYLRCILCGFSIITSISALVPGVISGNYFDGTDSRHWQPEDGGYLWHLLSTSSEWLLAFAQSILVLSFLPEFRKINVYSPVLIIEGVNKVSMSPAFKQRCNSILYE